MINTRVDIAGYLTRWPAAGAAERASLHRNADRERGRVAARSAAGGRSDLQLAAVAEDVVGGEADARVVADAGFVAAGRVDGVARLVGEAELRGGDGFVAGRRARER